MLHRRRFLATAAGGLQSSHRPPPRVGQGPDAAQREAQHRRHRRRRAGRRRDRATWPSEQNIVALCDVDGKYAAHTFKTYPKAEIFKDYRVLLEKRKDIDAVMIATPDHMHAPITLAALRAGQARVRREADGPHHRGGPGDDPRGQGDGPGHADGQQRPRRRGPAADARVDPGRRRSARSARSTAGATGRARSGSRAWSGRRRRRPCRRRWTGTCGSAPRRSGRTIPSTARARGAAGSISAPAPWATWPSTTWTRPSTPWTSTAPVAAEAQTSQPLKKESYPAWQIITYEFAAKGNRPAVKMIWYDGGKMPPRPAELRAGPQAGRQRHLLRRRQGHDPLRRLVRHAAADSREPR